MCLIIKYIKYYTPVYWTRLRRMVPFRNFKCSKHLKFAVPSLKNYFYTKISRPKSALLLLKIVYTIFGNLSVWSNTVFNLNKIHGRYRTWKYKKIYISRVVCYVTRTATWTSPRGRFMQLYNLKKGKLTKPSSSPKDPHIRLHC